MTTTGSDRAVTSDDAMHAALAAVERRERAATKIRAVRHERTDDVIIVELSTGSTLTVPRDRILGFARASHDALGDVAITPGSEGL